MEPAPEGIVLDPELEELVPALPGQAPKTLGQAIADAINAGNFISQMAWVTKMKQEVEEHNDHWMFEVRPLFFDSRFRTSHDILLDALDECRYTLSRTVLARGRGHVLISHVLEAHEFLWMKEIDSEVVGMVCTTNPELLEYTRGRIVQDWPSWKNPPEVPPIPEQCVMAALFANQEGVPTRHSSFSPADIHMELLERPFG